MQTRRAPIHPPVLAALAAFASLVASLALAACSPAPGSAPAGSAASVPASGIDLAGMDRSVAPGDDFFRYANGTWLKNAEIPADRSAWGSSSVLDEQTSKRTSDLVAELAKAPSPAGSDERKIGDTYASFMDEAAIEAKGLEPLRPDLARVAAISDGTALARELGSTLRVDVDVLNATNFYTPNLFGLWVAQDLDAPGRYAPFLLQGGLGMPDRDYYLKDDDKTKAIRDAFVKYVGEVYVLAETPVGASAPPAGVTEKASQVADTVLRIETALAKAQMDRTARRDPKTRDHKMSRTEAIALASNFHLDKYFQDVNAPAFTELNVGNPEFFKDINAVLESESLESLKTYVGWHLLHAAAPWLSQPFVEANFRYQQVLTGQKEIQARWKRCVNLTDRELGEALGQKYVEVAFPPESKARMLKMVDALEKSLDGDIQNLSWMSPETKKQAKVKLDAIRNKIGYPSVWRDYSSVVVKPDDLLGNIARANEFESKRQIA
jgi:predicted metalloendopeptidase